MDWLLSKNDQSISQPFMASSGSISQPIPSFPKLDRQAFLVSNSPCTILTSTAPVPASPWTHPLSIPGSGKAYLLSNYFAFCTVSVRTSPVSSWPMGETPWSSDWLFYGNMFLHLLFFWGYMLKDAWILNKFGRPSQYLHLGQSASMLPPLLSAATVFADIVCFSFASLCRNWGLENWLLPTPRNAPAPHQTNTVNTLATAVTVNSTLSFFLNQKSVFSLCTTKP